MVPERFLTAVTLSRDSFRLSSNRLGLVVLSLLWIAGCSHSPPPEVATQYADQFGATEAAGSSKCPALDGVWNLAAPSGGDYLQSSEKYLSEGLMPHLRWPGKTLFGLTPGLSGVIAASPRYGTTLFFSDIAYTEASPMPVSARGSVAYAELSASDFPCVGSGWRKGASRDHSLNDAAARVLLLVPEKPVSISQVDYMALSTSGELLLGTHLQYRGIDKAGKEVNDAYWHFVKLPRIASDAGAAGFNRD